MFDEILLSKARAFLDAAQSKSLTLTTAESCTGGLIAGLLTEVPGSSRTLERGFVVYSNRAKQDMLDVPGEMLADYGAVSEPVSRAMAEGAIAHSRADLAIAVTGIAGPSGDTPMKPVGLVHIAVLKRDKHMLHQMFEFGNVGRQKVRELTVLESLKMLHELIS